MMLCDAMFRIKRIPWVLACVYVALWLLYLASDSDWKLLVLYYPLYPLSRLILLVMSPWMDRLAANPPSLFGSIAWNFLWLVCGVAWYFFLGTVIRWLVERLRRRRNDAAFKA